MRYLIVQDWDNTHGNHAGMVHMCKLLCEKYPDKYRMFVNEAPKPNRASGNGLVHRIRQHFERLAERKKNAKEYIKLCTPMFAMLKEGDEVFLLEYNWPQTSQYELACYIKNCFNGVKLYALSHLTPTYFNKLKDSKKYILEWDKPIDKQLTLGTSLTSFFKEIGISEGKISTGFHYVDGHYYNNVVEYVNNPITVITIGALQRDFQLLADVVKGNPEVNWIICKGRKNIDGLFTKLDNVTLVGYVQEDDLKRYMSISDISLNILEDTVGSNVITTSMAMGLGIVVSDVGSIHDYCDDTNAVFCLNTAESFSNAIRNLSHNKGKVLAMRQSSYEKSTAFKIQKIDEWFNTLNE